MEGEVTNILLNGMELPFFIAMLLLAFAGVIAFFAIEVIKAIKYDMRTPKKFDFKTMIKMSLLRILLALIIIPISIIYFGEISKVVFQIPDPLEMNGFVAFWLGVSIDKVLDGIIGGSKEGISILTKKP
jgi:hypothetical protein